MLLGRTGSGGLLQTSMGEDLAANVPLRNEVVQEPLTLMEEAQDSTLATVLAPAAMALPPLLGALTSEDTVATELGEEIWSPEDCGRPSGSRGQETNKTHIENRVITNFPLPTMASPLFENDEEGAAYLLEL